MNINLKKFFALSLLALIFSSCQTISSINDVSEERGYVVIKNEYERGDWETVITDVGEFRSRYPYSKRTPELELIQADSYFRSRNYPSAIVTYEDFIRRNPNDSNLALANYRIAESYDRDASKEVDRDQTNTQRAVDKYKEFLVKFPNSTEFDKSAETRIQILNKRLAEHSLFIATFYWNKHMWAAALMRYLYIIDNYKQFPEIVKVAKKNGSYCYKKLADILEKKPKSEEYIFFKNETPQGLREKAKAL